MRNAPGTGGSDGCVNFEDGDNAGLPGCLVWTGLESIYNKWCDKISLENFMVTIGAPNELLVETRTKSMGFDR